VSLSRRASDNNGFTLIDLVSHNRKHNAALHPVRPPPPNSRTALIVTYWFISDVPLCGNQGFCPVPLPNPFWEGTALTPSHFDYISTSKFYFFEGESMLGHYGLTCKPNRSF
jgi:hypothetical protein